MLYSAVRCGYCAKAEAYLADKGVAYREIDIDTPDGMASFAQVGGGRQETKIAMAIMKLLPESRLAGVTVATG